MRRDTALATGINENAKGIVGKRTILTNRLFGGRKESRRIEGIGVRARLNKHGIDVEHAELGHHQMDARFVVLLCARRAVFEAHQGEIKLRDPNGTHVLRQGKWLVNRCRYGSDRARTTAEKE